MAFPTGGAAAGVAEPFWRRDPEEGIGALSTWHCARPGARSGKVVFRFSCKIARPTKNLERPPNYGAFTEGDPALERDQEKWSSGFPVKSRDQQRI